MPPIRRFSQKNDSLESFLFCLEKIQKIDAFTKNAAIQSLNVLIVCSTKSLHTTLVNVHEVDIKVNLPRIVDTKESSSWDD